MYTSEMTKSEGFHLNQVEYLWSIVFGGRRGAVVATDTWKAHLSQYGHSVVCETIERMRQRDIDPKQPKKIDLPAWYLAKTIGNVEKERKVVGIVAPSMPDAEAAALEASGVEPEVITPNPPPVPVPQAKILPGKNPTSDWYLVSEAAKMLKVSSQTIRNNFATQKLKGQREHIVRSADVEAYAQA
jgi:hypothetical protein